MDKVPSWSYSKFVSIEIGVLDYDIIAQIQGRNEHLEFKKHTLFLMVGV
jgi:hypothetical protein